MEMKAIQGREKRWTRRGRHVPSSMPGKREGEGQKDGVRAKKVDREKLSKAGTSGTVSHCLTLVSCPFFDARSDQRKREREGEGKKKRGK